jgi:hypothetical protein
MSEIFIPLPQKRREIIDFESCNSSFIKTAQDEMILSMPGQTRILLLNDPYLKKINPLTTKDPYIQEKIKKECQENKWYFFREVLRIQDLGCTDIGSQFDIDNVSALFLNLYFDLPTCKSIFLQKSRQTHQTTLALSTVLYRFLFGETRRYELLDVMQNNRLQMDRLIGIINYLPYYLKDMIINEYYCDTYHRYSLRLRNKHTNSVVEIGYTFQIQDTMDDFDTITFVNDYEFLLNSSEYNTNEKVQQNMKDLLEKSKYVPNIFVGTQCPVTHDKAVEHFTPCSGGNNSYTTSLTANMLYIKANWKDIGLPQEWYDDISKSVMGREEVLKYEVDLVL